MIKIVALHVRKKFVLPFFELTIAYDFPTSM